MLMQNGLRRERNDQLAARSCGNETKCNGNLRQVQEILGHAKLETIQIYTHVTISDLKKAYQKAHPSAKAREGIVDTYLKSNAKGVALP